MLKDRQVLYNGNPVPFVRDKRFTILENLEDVSRQQITFACPRDSDLSELMSAHLMSIKSSGIFEYISQSAYRQRRPEGYDEVGAWNKVTLI